jgi:TonB-linked SusC/RagA family outer membrane protein
MKKKRWDAICDSGWKKTFLMMRITMFFLLAGFLQVSASVYSQQTNLNLKVENATITEVLKMIEAQSEFHFLFRSDYFNETPTVTIEVEKAKLEEVLDKIIVPMGFSYEIDDKTVVIRKSVESPNVQPEKKTKVISGVVTDENKIPVPGVSVLVKGTTVGTVTDNNGKYSLSGVPSDAKILSFSFIGMDMQDLPIGDKGTINVVMKNTNVGVEEVVVVGYGTQKKANLTGAVDQVTGEVFDNRPIANVSQGLKGVIPNLNIKLQDGKPNQAPSYNIRGATSIGQGGSALVLIDGVEGDPSLLNPNDIASVSILKDAASASIYGARGAFGVVLLTTKNPEKGKTSVTFSSNFAVKDPVRSPDFVTDGYTWVKMFSEAFVNGDGSFPQNINKTLKFSQAYLDEFKRRVDSGQPYKTVDIDPVTGEYVYFGSTDWYHELYKNNIKATDNNLTITGSGDKVSYWISGRYMSQDGLFRYNSDDYNMKNFRGKGSIKLAPWLTVDNNTEYSEMFYHNPLNVGEGSGIWRNIADEGHPNGTMFNPDGSLTMVAVYNVGDFWYGINGIDNKKKVFKNTTGFTAQFLNNKLRIKGDFTFRNTNNNTEQKRVQVPYSNKPGVIAYVGTTTNDLAFDNRETQYLATNLYSEYENTFNKIHYLKFMLGYNYEQSTYNRLAVQRNGLIYEGATDLNLALGQSITTGGGYEKWDILGGFSRINYSYKDKYLVEFNGRYDGSSKFPANQRYAFFPSFSGGWRLSKESFWHVSPTLFSDVKLRASYGSLGNGNINSYVYQEQFSISQSSIILNGVKPQQTSRPSVLPDGITWETSTTSDFGLDFSMLNNRLNFVGDMYVRNTTNMFTIGLTLPATFGATPPKGNYADMRTNGWEMSISWRDKFNLASNPFHYDVKFTLADSKAEITRYNNPDKLLSDYYVGQVIGEMWGYETEGFFKDQADIDAHAKQSPQMRASPTNIWYPGDIKLKDLNHDGFINIGTNRVSDPGDRKIIGNTAAHYTYGINLGADWNNFFFSTYFNGVMKQDWYPSVEAEFFWGQYNRPYNNIPKWHLGNMWTPEHTDAYFPRTMSRAASSNTARELGVVQTKYKQNVAFIRMANIQFGYNLPKRLISKISATDAKVFFSGENLWAYSPLYKLVKGIDVENTVPSDQLFTTSNAGDGYNYPMLKSISFGLSVTF